MAKSAVLNVAVLVDAAKAAADLGGVGDAAESMGDKFKNLKGAIAGAAIVGVVSAAVAAASDLEQAMGGVDAVFKDSAKQIHAWASDSSDNIRLPAAEFEKFALQIGAQLKNAGVPMDQLAGKTKDILGLASDLSAQFGGSTADAVDTLSGALKGNIETLDNYGVSISASSVSAKAQAMGLDQSTEAAKASAKQQATLAIIFEQTADAQGAAGREADTFGSAQEHLNEVMTNFLAAVGAPLLDGLAGIVNGLSNILPLVTPLATALAGLVGWVLQLPAPLLLAVAGLVAWQVIGGLAGITAQFTAAVTKLTAAMKGLQTGTIIGAAFVAVMLAVSVLDAVFGQTGEAIKKTTEIYDKWKSTLKDGAVTDTTRKMIAIDSAASGLFDTYERLGISTQAYVDASTGVAGGQEARAKSVQQATNKLFQQGGAFEDVSGILSGAVVKQQEFVDAVASGNLDDVRKKVEAYAGQQSALSGNMQTATDIMDTFNAATVAGKDPVESITNAMGLADQNAGEFGVSAAQAAQAAKALGEDASSAGPSVEELKQALDDAKKAADATVGNAALNTMKTAADDATRATDLLSLALDKMTGGTRSTDAAVADFNKSISGVAGAFEDTAKKGGYSEEALVNWNVASLTATEAGQGIYDALTQVSSAYETSVGAAYASANASGGSTAALAAAQAEATRAHDAFIGQAAAMHLSADQTAALAAQLGVLDAQSLSPKVFELIAQDQQARDAVIALQNAGIPSKDFTVTAGVDGALGTVDDMLAYVDSTGATVTVESTVAPATADVAGLTKATNATTATTTTETNTAPAESAVKQFTGTARDTTVQVFANTNNAVNSINAVTTWVPSATIQVMGNTQSVRDSISDVVNGHYTATIIVTANVSQATAAIAAIPRSVGVSAPPPAPAVPALMAGGRSTASSGGTANVNYTINLTGGITDPAGAARAIRRVLQGDARRAGGVTAR